MSQGVRELLTLAPAVREAFTECELNPERQIRIHWVDKVDRIVRTDTYVGVRTSMGLFATAKNEVQGAWKMAKSRWRVVRAR